ncbi:MAG TPA: polysaccharide pyruvyl transferase family protein, partial [Segetibacter sp.]
MKFYYQIEGALRNNIGDVLQGMVAKAFLPDNATVVDREALADMDPNGASVLLANGWYMHSFEKFPPPANVNPIYVSVHMAQSQLLADSNVRKHFKKHSPIGCRDEKTLKLFLGWGIPAYYSGCLTITAKQRAPINTSLEGEVLLVDNIDHPIPDDVKIKLEKLLGKSFTRVSHDP